jgi:hypothetical protein
MPSASSRQETAPRLRRETAILGKNAPKMGAPPAIVLANPKYAHNVAMTVRLASCYGLGQVWFSGRMPGIEFPIHVIVESGGERVCGTMEPDDGLGGDESFIVDKTAH